MKISARARSSARPASDGQPGRLDSQRDPGPVRRAAVRRRVRLRAAGHRHGRQPAGPARGRGGRARASSCSRLGCCSTWSARCRRRGLARAAPGRAGRRADLRQRHLPHPHAARRGLPAVPGAGRGRRRVAARRRVRRDGAEGGRLGLARRDPPGAHRDPGLGLGARAADGRHRLLPAERQGDHARDAADLGFEVNVPARALQELARLAGQRRGRAAERQRAPEPGRVRRSAG